VWQADESNFPAADGVIFLRCILGGRLGPRSSALVAVLLQIKDRQRIAIKQDILMSAEKAMQALCSTSDDQAWYRRAAFFVISRRALPSSPRPDLPEYIALPTRAKARTTSPSVNTSWLPHRSKRSIEPGSRNSDKISDKTTKSASHEPSNRSSSKRCVAVPPGVGSSARMSPIIMYWKTSRPSKTLRVWGWLKPIVVATPPPPLLLTPLSSAPLRAARPLAWPLTVVLPLLPFSTPPPPPPVEPLVGRSAKLSPTLKPDDETVACGDARSDALAPPSLSPPPPVTMNGRLWSPEWARRWPGPRPPSPTAAASAAATIVASLLQLGGQTRQHDRR